MTTIENSNAVKTYWENRLSKKWGLHGVGHISYGRPYNEWLYRVRRRIFLRNLKLLPVRLHEANVLDIGSGTGFWLNTWQSLGVGTLVGSDMTRTAVRHLRTEHPHLEILELDISDTAEVRDISSRFQLISAFDVLYHIMGEDRFENAISNVARLLQPGGYFLFSDCFVHSGPMRSAHQVNRTLGRFSALLEANGLAIVSRFPMFVIMNTPIDSSTRIPQFIWRAAMVPVKWMPSLGHLYGAVLYPFEMMLTKGMKESWSTEFMICRKVT